MLQKITSIGIILSTSQQKSIRGGNTNEDGQACCEYSCTFHPECFYDPECNIYQIGNCIQYEYEADGGCSITGL